MRLRALLYAFGGLLWLALPLIVSAAGLVPCGLNNDAAYTCNICTFGQLIQNIINFAIGLSIPLSALLFTWAGWLYFSNRENPAQIERAQSIFKNVVIGLVIAMAGWLMVQTILKTLAPGYQSWTTFSCTEKRTIDTNIGQLLQQSGIGPVQGVPPVANVTTDYNGANPTVVVCQNGSTYVQAAQNCIDSSTGDFTAPVSESSAAVTGNSAAGTAQWAADLQAACQQSGLSDCALAQAIMANESNGKSASVSGKGAMGLMQVMPATACGMDPSINGCSTGDYTAVRQALGDPQTNMRLGTQYIAQLSNQFNGDPQRIAAAYNGGPPAAAASRSCGSGYAYQCTAVPNNFGETRNYVPKVLSTYNSLKSQ